MKQYLDLMRDVLIETEKAKSHRDYKTARKALLRNFYAVELCWYYDITSEQKEELKNKIKQALATLKTKLAITKTGESLNSNSAMHLLLRYKLKPTNDGKTDSLTDIKGRSKPITFFINLWNQEHVQSQNRAFA
jgi:hypothetical protein